MGWEVGSIQKISLITIHPEVEARRESGKQKSKSEAHPCFLAPGNFRLGCQPNVSQGQMLPVLIMSTTHALNASHPESSPVGSDAAQGQSPKNLHWAQAWTHLSQVWTGRWDFLSRISTLGGSSSTALVLPKQVGAGLKSSNTDDLWPTSTPSEFLTPPSAAGQGRALTQYLPVRCPVFSTDCLIQSWVLSIWNNFRSSSSRAMSPQKTAGGKT